MSSSNLGKGTMVGKEDYVAFFTKENDKATM